MDRRVDRRLNTYGRVMSQGDKEFVNLLMAELEQFERYAQKDRALMFHPLSGYERYLIHKATETFPKLTSFSVNEHKDRRVCVCYKSKRKEQQEQLGKLSMTHRPPSRETLGKDPRARDDPKKRVNGHNPSVGRHHTPDSALKGKLGKYSTISNDAVRKRERGLGLEGHVVNGDSNIPKSDTEDPRSKKHADYIQKHRARRSHSQPHLNERPRSRHRRDSFDESPDRQYSEVEDLHRKPNHTLSENNMPRRNKSRYPIHTDMIEPIVSRHSFDNIRTSSESDSTHRVASDNDENEVPPSYEKTSHVTSKDKAKRNLKRIKRTNSTRSCPPLDEPKRDYVNVDTALLKSDNVSGQHASPVFPKKIDNSHTAPDKKSKDKAKKSKKHKSKKVSREPSREYVNVPKNEIHRQNSYESSQFDPSWVGDHDPIPNGVSEVTAVVENVPFSSDMADSQTVPVSRTISSAGEEIKNAMTLANEVSLKPYHDAATIVDRVDKEVQTDLRGSVVDVVMTAYNTQLDALGRATGPTNPASFVKPTSLAYTPASSTPSTSSPASAYEKLGEHMYKAMLNFQSMLVEGPAPPHNFRPSSGPESILPAPMYPPMSHTAQPVYVPWMSSFYPDPTTARPPVMPYQSQPQNSWTQHQPTNGPSSLPGVRPHMDSFASTSSRDNVTHHRKPRSSRSKSGSVKNLEHAVLGHPSISSKRVDTFDSDASSEMTNPELTVAEGGDGLAVYVRNASNRSTSSAAGSTVGSTTGFPVASGDARASPLGHDNDDVFRKLPKAKSVDLDKKEEGTKRTKSVSKKMKSDRKKDKPDKPVLAKKVDRVAILAEEVVPVVVAAPLAKLEDDLSSSSTSSSSSRRSSLSDRRSETPDADLTRSLAGEDLSPVVCYDDNLEIACEAGSNED